MTDTLMYCTSPMLMVETFEKQLKEPTNQNSKEVPKVVKEANKKALL